MNGTRAHRAYSEEPTAATCEPVLFESTCPACKYERIQRCSRNGLARLLHHGHPVEAYCAMCDEYWQITARERARLAAEHFQN